MTGFCRGWLAQLLAGTQRDLSMRRSDHDRRQFRIGDRHLWRRHQRPGRGGERTEIRHPRL